MTNQQDPVSRPRLSDADVLAIRRDRARGESLESIAARYGLSKRWVATIVRGRAHSHLPVLPSPDMRRSLRSAPDPDAPRTIRRRWADGEAVALIARDYGMSSTTVMKYVREFIEDDGPQWRRVDPVAGARYRDALLAVAELGGEGGAVAREALGLAQTGGGWRERLARDLERSAHRDS